MDSPPKKSSESRVYNASMESFARETIRAALAILRDADLRVPLRMREVAGSTLSKILDVEIAQSLLNDKDITWPLSVVVEKSLWNYLDDLIESATQLADFQLEIARSEVDYRQLQTYRKALVRLETFSDRSAMQDRHGMVVSESIPLGGYTADGRIATYVDYSMEFLPDDDKSKRFLDGFEKLQHAANWKQTFLQAKERICSHKSPNSYSDHKDCLTRLNQYYVRAREEGEKATKWDSEEENDDEEEICSFGTDPRARKPLLELNLPDEEDTRIPYFTTPSPSELSRDGNDGYEMISRPLPQLPARRESPPPLTTKDFGSLHITYSAVLHTPAGNFVAELPSSSLSRQQKQRLESAKEMWTTVAKRGCHDRISWAEAVECARSSGEKIAEEKVIEEREMMTFCRPFGGIGGE